ncbi:hypothetical protein BVY01_04190 [bacterium I07]|nr:hypothetical protein BVY01_04190 [bacterium I07]
MFVNRNRLGILLFGMLLTACSFRSVAGVDGDIKKSFRVKRDGWLHLETDIGTIEVTAAGSNEVTIEVRFESKRGNKKRVKEFLDDFDVIFKQDGTDVRVNAEYKQDRWRFWDRFGKYVRVEFIVSVPEEYNVDLKTSGGSITVDDLEGEVESRTSGGSLTFGNIKGPVNGRTSGGSISLEGCDGIVQVKTSGGGIKIGKVKGEIDAHTSGGSIHVEEVMGSINAGTSGGSVTANITKQPDHDCRLTTSGGSVKVYLSDNVRLNLNARTSGGRVVTDIPVTVKGEISKRALKAELNGGGPELYLRTSGGSIYIKEH